MNPDSIQTIDLRDAKPCPFCGASNLSVVLWCDDDGEFDAIECDECKGAAPADVWNKRRGNGTDTA